MWCEGASTGDKNASSLITDGLIIWLIIWDILLSLAVIALTIVIAIVCHRQRHTHEVYDRNVVTPDPSTDGLESVYRHQRFMQREARNRRVEDHTGPYGPTVYPPVGNRS